MPRSKVTRLTEARVCQGHHAAGLKMRTDERDVLDVLKSELEYLSSGAYSQRESWGPRFIFEDSPTCVNFGHSDNPSPCSGCVLIDLVPPEHRADKFPCRHILLDASGQTLDSLYRHSDEREIEAAVRNWLQATIQRLEREREAFNQKEHRENQESSGIPLYERLHPKCANPACPR